MFGAIKVFLVKRAINKSVEEVEGIFKNVEDETQAKKLGTKVEVEDENNNTSSPIGLLTIKLDKNYKVAIYDNVTTENLKKGAGRLTGLAKLNEKGNCILYGHRDSAFKPLWKIKVGDKLELKSLYSTKNYEVYNIYITVPDDTNIVRKTDDFKLTLVTCYPFTYSGAAKQRCIVECKICE